MVELVLGRELQLMGCAVPDLGTLAVCHGCVVLTVFVSPLVLLLFSNGDGTCVLLPLRGVSMAVPSRNELVWPRAKQALTRCIHRRPPPVVRVLPQSALFPSNHSRANHFATP